MCTATPMCNWISFFAHVENYFTFICAKIRYFLSFPSKWEIYQEDRGEKMVQFEMPTAVRASDSPINTSKNGWSRVHEC